MVLMALMTVINGQSFLVETFNKIHLCHSYHSFIYFIMSFISLFVRVIPDIDVIDEIP